MVKLGAQVVVIIILFSPIFLSPLLSPLSVVADGSIVSAQDVTYQSHAPIAIGYNDDLVVQGWNGTGTAEDPFVIENLNITTDWVSCISIYGTGLHLIIRNCLLHSLRSSAIRLDSVSNCIVESCIMVQVSVSRSNSCSFISNDFQGYGLYLSSSSNISVIHNKLGSLWISGESEENWQHTIVNNTVNGKPLVFIHDENSLLINPDGYGSLILVNCTNVNIANGSLGTGQGTIQLGYCKHVGISNNMGYVVHCTQSSDLRIHDNTMAANVTMGIELFECNNTLVESNSIYGNRFNGIAIYDSDNCTVHGNTVIGEVESIGSGQDNNLGFHGITLDSSTGCLVDGNTVDASPGSGIYAIFCPALPITNNLITNNQGNGIEMFGGNGTISRNILYSNQAPGIGLKEYQNSTIESNDISNNTVGITAEYDCFNVTISMNEIHEASTDIVLDTSRSFCIKDNVLSGLGLSVIHRLTDTMSNWHHIIENNTLNGGPLGYLWGQKGGSIHIHDYGFTQLIIANSSALHVYDGQFSNSSFLIAYSSNLVVDNIRANQSVLQLVGSEGCHIQNCTFSANSRLGIDASKTCYVQDCVFSQSYAGLYESDAIQVGSNIFQDSGANLLLYESSFCLVSDNEFISSGVLFYGYVIQHWTHSFSGNTVNNRPLGYFRQLSDTSIDTSEYGALILVDCHDLNVSGGSFQNTSYGVQIAFCTDCVVSAVVCTDNYECAVRIILSPNCTLRDSLMTGSKYGVDIGTLMGQVKDVTVSNCTVTNNTLGICVVYDGSVKIIKSIISNNEQQGILLEYSDDAWIENNTISGNGGAGISYWFSAERSTITGNEITANSGDGIHGLGYGCIAARNYITGNSGHGLAVFGSNSSINSNWIVANNDTGIEVQYGNNLTISSNVICNNTAYGLYIRSNTPDVVSSNNTIYNNLIGWNEEGNAFDDGLTNMWDNGTLGNAWSDYDGSGSYQIAGSAGSIDHFPRLLKVFPITSRGTTNGQTEAIFQPLLWVCSFLISAEVAIAVLIIWRSRENTLAHTFDT